MAGYLHWCDFLDDDLLALARHTVISNRINFIRSTVTTGLHDFRKSEVLWQSFYQELYERFACRLRGFHPHLRNAFPQLTDAPGIEMQLTMHGDGEFFKRHVDDGAPETNHRLLTYVYYFSLTDAQQFTGGQLILETASGTYCIEPRHNTIVWFPAGCQHEVSPVNVPSHRWEDGRATINGWLLR